MTAGGLRTLQPSCCQPKERNTDHTKAGRRRRWGWRAGDLTAHCQGWRPAGAEACHQRVLQTSQRRRVHSAQVPSPGSQPGALLVPASRAVAGSLGLTKPHMSTFSPLPKIVLDLPMSAGTSLFKETTDDTQAKKKKKKKCFLCPRSQNCT